MKFADYTQVSIILNACDYHESNEQRYHFAMEVKHRVKMESNVIIKQELCCLLFGNIRVRQ